MLEINLILEKKKQLHNMDTDSFVLSMDSKKIIEDVKTLEDLFDFSNLKKNHETFSNKNKNVIGKLQIETPEKVWIDEFACLRSKAYTFKCGSDKKQKIKDISISHSKHKNLKVIKKV